MGVEWASGELTVVDSVFGATTNTSRCKRSMTVLKASIEYRRNRTYAHRKG